MKEQIASCRRQMASEPDKSEMFRKIIAIYERELDSLSAQAESQTHSSMTS